ncbi:universal stress protein [Hoyosella altamirensis]|uniref:universal stress protein n=1 Tax=Hoyosella altamirensis TaxID=616997 RepID=UPI0007DB0F11|nr:universal stress protein [Hoyosella altamirensis]
MAIMVAVTDTDEGAYALATAIREARELHTNLVILNLAARRVDTSSVPSDVPVDIVTRNGPEDRDHAQVILNQIHEHEGVTRLILGVHRRSPVGKATLGNVSHRVLLEAPVPVLAVKVPE